MSARRVFQGGRARGARFSGIGKFLRGRPNGRRETVDRPHAERLEQRLLLSITTLGVPDWLDVGSKPIVSAGSVSDPNNPAGGAVEDLAIHPANPAIMYAGTVNGGIWRTTNGNRPFNGVDDDGVNGVDDAAEQPDWYPLTDDYPSLAIGDIRFDFSDPTGNTVFAGTGTTSSKGGSGGRAIGIFKTTDGGTTWQVFPVNPGGSEPRIRAVLPTAIDGDGAPGLQQVVLVGTTSGTGLYRSIDAGETYAAVSGTGTGLPTGAVTDIITDPNNPSLLYSGVVGQGVYSSSDGLNWSATDNASLTNLAGSAVVQLTAHPGGGSTVLYTLVSGDSPAAYTSSNGGTSWTALAAVPAAFTSTYGNLYTTRAADQLIVDPSNSQIVYISKGYGGSPMVYRYDPGGPTWDQIEDSAEVDNTRPHVDQRDLQFTVGGGDDVLIAANDGGLYFLRDPQNPGGNHWTSLHGVGTTSLGVTEYTNVAWDSTFNVVTGGSQDNGTSVQIGFLDPVWTSYRGADGGDVQVDTVNAGAGQVFRYSGWQKFGLERHTFDSATNQPVAAVALVPGTGLAGFSNYFVPQYELNAVDPSRLVAGGSGTSPVYELLNAATAPNDAGANWVAVPIGAGFSNVNDNDDAPIAYGGRLNGMDNPEVLVVGSGSGVFVRSTSGGTLTATPTGFPGGTVEGITLDPENWQHMFVADGSGVWETLDAGNTWTDLTGNLRQINSRLQSIDYVPVGPSGVVLAGGNFGVSRLSLVQPNAVWTRYGAGLPNALVSDLEYNATDDILLAGTYGRGALLIQNASTTVNVPGVIEVDGGLSDDLIELRIDANNPAMLSVTLNGMTEQFQVSLFELISVNGLAGNDTLIVDHSNGLVNVPRGIQYDGGTFFDKLQVIGPEGFDVTYDVGPGNGQGVLTQTDGVTFAEIYFTNLEPIEILGGGAGTTLTVVAPDSDNAIDYVEGPNSLDAGHVVFAGDTTGIVAVDAFETIEFSNYEHLVIGAGAGSDTINLNNPATPTTLADILVAGQDDTGGDLVIVNGTAAQDDIDYSPLGITSAQITGAQPVAVDVETTENVLINGQGGNDELTISTTTYEDTIVHTPGAAGDEGTLALSLPGFGDTPVAVAYADLGLSGSLVFGMGSGTDTLVVRGTDGNDSVAVSSAGAVTLTSSLEEHVLLKPDGQEVESLILEGLDGDDAFSLVAQTAYDDIAVHGGNPSASDVVEVAGDGTAITVDLAAAEITGGGLGTVTLAGVEQLDVAAAGGDLNVEAGITDDTVEVTPLTSDAGVLTSDVWPGVLNFGTVGNLTVELLSGQDTLIVNGSPDGETVTATGSDVQVAARATVNYTGAETLVVNALGGSDTFNVTPSATVEMFIDGGDPIGTLPGDLLSIDAGGQSVTFNAGPEADEGSIDVGADQPVSFDHIESLAVTNPGPVVINGTNAPDAITVIARDGSTHAGADGVQDFTVVINAGPEILFIDASSLTVNALAGSDEIVLKTPAPNNADWDVDVTIDGGEPAASDRLIVSTPGFDSETTVYSPNHLSIAEATPADSTEVDLLNIEELFYNGEGDGDTLRVQATGADELIVHTPAAAPDAGTVQVAGGLPLNYLGLGLGAVIQIDGVGGADELVYMGTPGNDAFMIDVAGPGGQIGLDARTPVQTENIPTATLEGLDGDDSFSLVPALSASPYDVLNLHGGLAASAIGDRAYVTGTAGDDEFLLSGQTVQLGGKAVRGVDVEDIQIGALAGTDQITYRGVDGISEDIAIVASTTPNAGQVSVPGVALFEYLSVERFEAIGSDGSAGDADTLTVFGTELDDLFLIDLNAAGTAAEPVLKMQDAAGAVDMLTLLNYTNFRTLNIESLDGQDTFNVMTGPTVGREISIDAGLPEGKKRRRPADATDIVRVFYVGKRPRITHNTETQDPDSALIDVLYDTGARSVIQYRNVEKVYIKKA